MVSISPRSNGRSTDERVRQVRWQYAREALCVNFYPCVRHRTGQPGPELGPRKGPLPITRIPEHACTRSRLSFVDNVAVLCETYSMCAGRLQGRRVGRPPYESGRDLLADARKMYNIKKKGEFGGFWSSAPGGNTVVRTIRGR
jgi:hypothetical protein